MPHLVKKLLLSGIYDKASFSIGQYYFKTNGFRENNDLKDNIFNAFLQYSIFPQTSIQAEFRYRDTEYGELQLRFFQDDFFPNQRQREETDFNTPRFPSRLFTEF